jgi:hypothetical protein
MSPTFLNKALGSVSCLTDWMKTLSRCTWKISVPESHVRSTKQQHKMADVMDVHTRRRVVTEFLTVGSSLIEIHIRLRSMCGEDTIKH